MRFITRLSAVAMLVTSAGLVLSIVFPSPARGAGSAPVLVTNTAAQPVPVALKDTGNIGGTVNAVQSGPWGVSVLSVPPVSIAPGASVRINNSPAAPIPTKEVRSPAHDAGVIDLCAVDSGQASVVSCGGGNPPTSFAMPAGQRMVVEHISIDCAGASRVLLKVVLNAANYGYAFPGGVFAMPARLYVDQVSLFGVSDAITSCFVALTGHAVTM